MPHKEAKLTRSSRLTSSPREATSFPRRRTSFRVDINFPREAISFSQLDSRKDSRAMEVSCLVSIRINEHAAGVDSPDRAVYISRQGHMDVDQMMDCV